MPVNIIRLYYTIRKITSRYVSRFTAIIRCLKTKNVKDFFTSECLTKPLHGVFTHLDWNKAIEIGIILSIVDTKIIRF